MAKFRFFNVQVLPISPEVPEVKPMGYRRLWRRADVERRRAFRKKSIMAYSFPLPSGMHLAFFQIHFDEYPSHNRIYGVIGKFDQPKALLNTYTGEELLKLQSGISSSRHEYDFVFDLSTHILAVDYGKAGLPQAGHFIDFLNKSLGPVVREKFPRHTLTINQITDSRSVDQMYADAGYFKSIKVEITYSNATEFQRAMDAEIELDMKSRGITTRVLEEKAAKKGGQISEPTDEAKAMLSIAKTHGNALITYWNKVTKKLQRFSFETMPFMLEIRRKQPRFGETESEYRDRVMALISAAGAQSQHADNAADPEDS